MKNLYKYVFMGILAIGLGSCDDDEENVTVVVQDTVETGAVLRTIQITANEVNNENTEGGLFLTIEEQDEEGGDLLDFVNVYITYADNSEADGDSSNTIEGQEILLRTIQASEFTDGPFGLPRFDLTITTQDFLDATNSSLEAIFGRDTYTTRLELNLTDGRIFSTNNAGGIITAGFFNSPFQYITSIISPIASDAFTGDYMIENVTPVDFGNLYAEGSIVILSQPGAVSVERAFTAVALEDLGIGQPATQLAFQFVVDQVIPNDGQGTNLACGGSLTLGSPIGDTFGSFDIADDTVFDIVIGYNESGDATCATPSDGVIKLTKQ